MSCYVYSNDHRRQQWSRNSNNERVHQLYFLRPNGQATCCAPPLLPYSWDYKPGEVNSPVAKRFHVSEPVEVLMKHKLAVALVEVAVVAAEIIRHEQCAFLPQ